MQHIPEIKGVKLFEFLRSIYDAKQGTTSSFLQFKKIIEPLMIEIQLEKDFLRRDLNVGFSGGEKKKDEILQMLTLQPKLAILDETDSGLDVDAIRTVSKGINMYKNEENAVLIITHGTKILQNLHVDYVHVLVGGKIVKTSNGDLAEQIEEEGYAQYLN
jgi:Fe-S cluster assembly ATP-binding protein